MKKWLMVIVISLLVIPFVSAEEKKLNVVTTTTDLKSITESVGGEFVSVKSICQGDQDPHFIQAKPVYMTWSRNTDLWIRIGMELEIGYEEPIIDGSRNTKIKIGSDGHLDASENILRLEVPTTQKVDRAMGDIHPLGNPHYWLDPYNGRVVAKNITERLKKLVPEHKEDFDKNYAVFIKKLDEAMFGIELVKEIGGNKLWELELANKLDGFLIKLNEERKKQDKPLMVVGGWAGKMKPYQGKKIITYHRSWTYFVDRFDLVVSEELEPKPGIPPSPKHLVDVIKKIKADGVKILLMENFYSRQSPDFVSDKTGITIVEVANSVSGEKAATDYIAMIDNVVNKVEKAFSGK
jgi:ABC-type Zn uptake system ZnuABC Zn-binding protein ZnuA